jgi:uncharacterized membrane protein YoaK (UPF0700 family)
MLQLIGDAIMQDLLLAFVLVVVAKALCEKLLQLGWKPVLEQLLLTLLLLAEVLCEKLLQLRWQTIVQHLFLVVVVVVVVVALVC